MLEFLGDYLGLGLNGIAFYVLPFLIVLSLLVFVHEWGHYIVARWCGVHVETFSIGFGKELFGWTDRHNTRWKFSLIPLGGYVQMYGDTDPSSSHSKAELLDNEKTNPMTTEEKKRAFFTKPVHQRAAIVFAGPAINFLFAIIILFALYTTYGKPVNPPVAAAVIVSGAGDMAGIQPQDRILSIDGDRIQGFSDIQRQVAISLDRPIDIEILRGDEVVTLTVKPELNRIEDRFGFSQSRGMIGIMGNDRGVSADSIQTLNGQDVTGLSQEALDSRIESSLGQIVTIGLPGAGGEITQVRAMPRHYLNEDGQRTLFLTESNDKEIVEYGPLKAARASLEETWFIVTATMEAIGQMFTGTRSATELGGIVRIGAIAGDAAQTGMIAIVTFTALLSINLGLINLFPIPLLDGGHLVFYAYEAIFKKPMSEKVMDYALKFGMVLLIGLMAFANINDIVQIIL
jgi:regulator of sigma E protease